MGKAKNVMQVPKAGLVLSSAKLAAKTLLSSALVLNIFRN